MSSANMAQVRSSSGSHDRKLRYRALLEDLSTLEDEGADSVECIERTSYAVRQAQVLLAEGGVEERVKHPGEGYLDSRVLQATSDLALRCSEAVSGNANTYDRHELAAHIRENPDFWTVSFPHEVPPVAFLFGTFAPTPPEQRPRAPRQKHERQRAAALSVPESVNRLDKTEEGTEMVSRVFSFIRKWCRARDAPLSYFHAVLDPTSFSRTIENVYYLSFLARDGKIAIDIDEEHGLPFIRPVPSHQRQLNTCDVTDENQFIVSIDIHRWQELIQAFDIQTPLMVLSRQ